jgi:elongation factor Tu
MYQKIVVFLNKCDMVEDEDMLELVEEEIRDLAEEARISQVMKFLSCKRICVCKALENASDEEGAAKCIWDLCSMQSIHTFQFLWEKQTNLSWCLVEDVFSIKGRGTVITGRIERGIVKIEWWCWNRRIGWWEEKDYRYWSRNVPQTIWESWSWYELLDCSWEVLKKNRVERGQVVAKPGTVTPHKKFEAEVYVLKKEEGGRHTPFMGGYRPQFFFRTTDVTGGVQL